MKTIENGVRGIGLALSLNWDHLFYVGSIALALGLAGFLVPVLT